MNNKEKIIEEHLMSLKADLPTGRTLSESEKKDLIDRIGPRTVRNIIKAKKEFPKERIPFLFSSLDSQDVVDILFNNWSRLIKRLFAKPNIG